MENNSIEKEKNTKKEAKINLRGLLIASILFACGYVIGDLHAPILTVHNGLIAVMVIAALSMAVFIHNYKRG
jgi:hypothetical protein